MLIKQYINVKNAIRLQQIVVEVFQRINDGVEKSSLVIFLYLDNIYTKI